MSKAVAEILLPASSLLRKWLDTKMQEPDIMIVHGNPKSGG
jgi:hypothetical protein